MLRWDKSFPSKLLLEYLVFFNNAIVMISTNSLTRCFGSIYRLNKVVWGSSTHDRGDAKTLQNSDYTRSSTSTSKNSLCQLLVRSPLSACWDSLTMIKSSDYYTEFKLLLPQGGLKTDAAWQVYHYSRNEHKACHLAFLPFSCHLSGSNALWYLVLTFHLSTAEIELLDSIWFAFRSLCMTRESFIMVSKTLWRMVLEM